MWQDKNSLKSTTCVIYYVVKFFNWFHKKINVGLLLQLATIWNRHCEVCNLLWEALSSLSKRISFERLVSSEVSLASWLFSPIYCRPGITEEKSIEWIERELEEENCPYGLWLAGLTPPVYIQWRRTIEAVVEESSLCAAAFEGAPAVGATPGIPKDAAVRKKRRRRGRRCTSAGLFMGLCLSQQICKFWSPPLLILVYFPSFLLFFQTLRAVDFIWFFGLVWRHCFCAIFFWTGPSACRIKVLHIVLIF